MKKCLQLLLLAFSAVLFVACSDPDRDAEKKPIGTVTMQEDGTLSFKLKGSDTGLPSDLSYEVKPDDPDYDNQLRSVEPIEPGETKEVTAVIR